MYTMTCVCNDKGGGGGGAVAGCYRADTLNCAESLVSKTWIRWKPEEGDHYRAEHKQHVGRL